MKFQPEDPKKENSDYHEIFMRWSGKIKRNFPSSVDENNRATSDSIKNRQQYRTQWTKLFNTDSFPSPGTIKVENEKGKMVEKDKAHPIFYDLPSTREAADEDNLRKLVKILQDTNAGKSEEIARGILRSLGESDNREQRMISKIGRELKSYNRLIDDFMTIALQVRSDYDPDSAEENENPYQMRSTNIGTVVSKLTKDDMIRLERIFEAKGGSEDEQRAYKFNFDGDIDQRLKDSWNDLRVKLNEPVEYYTFEHEQRDKPTFEALIYIFNKLGTGRTGQRFFREGKRGQLRSAIKELKRRQPKGERETRNPFKSKEARASGDKRREIAAKEKEIDAKTKDVMAQLRELQAKEESE